MLLEFERRKRAAREIVADAAILHGRPVAQSARGNHARCSGQRQQLFEGLHAVKDARAGCANDGCVVRADDQNVSFRFHSRIEGEVVASEAGLRRVRAIAEKGNAVRRLRAGVRLICGGRQAFQRILEIARGELIFRVVAGSGDENPIWQFSGLPKMRFARRGKKGNLCLCGAETSAGK